MKSERCPEHQARVPCRFCAADHAAGEHVAVLVDACPRCAADAEADRLRREAFHARPDTGRAAANDREDDDL